jgi:trk system potassium uptake protein TrkA
VLVIGLGRFGTSIAENLTLAGIDVLGIDTDERLVKEWADRIAVVLQADATDLEALEQVGVEGISRAVVAIGTSVEASVLAVSHLSDLGVPTIWAKALSPEHGRILQRIGAHRVVYPEREVGAKIAALLADDLLDYLAIGHDHALAAALPPEAFRGRTLAEVGAREAAGVTVVAVLRPDGSVQPATPDTVLGVEDIAIVLGTKAHIAALSPRQ